MLAIRAHAGAAGHGDSGKRGIGLTESSGADATVLRELKVHWYYNWSAQTQLKTEVPFVPMAFSPKRLSDISKGLEFVLGFNEPDNAKQSDVPVQQALDAWPQLASKAKNIGAPAMAKNPIKPGNWFPAFMEKSPRVDFITLHWYKGVKAKAFIEDVKALCEAYHKPVWVTEFAPQTSADARAQPNKYTQAEVDAFIQETTRWMQSDACVQRYAWHDSKVGTSALFVDGKLTDTGKTYSQVGSEQ
jgi:hypothetical protein